MRTGIAILIILAGVPLGMAQEIPDTLLNETLQEVVVVNQGSRKRLENKRLGTEHLEMSKISQLPQLFGERDIIKSVTLMPGVHSEGEGSGGFEVRGGNASQNLILLDGMTLYNPSHVMGIFSTFNSDAINRATLFKGPFPATYGEAVSSVLDVGLKSGDMKIYHASATLGLLAAKFQAEGPIVRDKLSFAITGRRSYLDMFLKMTDDYKSTVLYFYDVTAKIRYKPDQNNYFDFSFIYAHDNMALRELMGMQWGNMAGSINWRHRKNDNLRFTTTASCTEYKPTVWMSLMNVDQTMRQYIRNANLTEKIDYMVNDYNCLQFGCRSEYFEVKSGEFEMNNSLEREVRSGWQNAAWINYDGSFNEHWAAETGIRFSFFNALTHHKFRSMNGECPNFKNKFYFDSEFRISLKYILSPLHNLKFGLGDVTQNLHAVRSNSTSMPFDRYALTSSGVKPERSFQLGLGYCGMTGNGDYDWSVELYGRESKNVYDYKDGMTMYSSVDLESIISGGKGRSLGAEFMVRKNNGKLTGWVSYTISKTMTKIPGINNGRWYEASNDRRHDFNISAFYSLSSRWTISASWVFASGTPLTAPDAKYELDGTTYYYYAKRNGYHTPSTHHLDISAGYKKAGRKLTQEVTFGFYNVYNYYSPYIIYFEDDNSKPSGTRAVEQSLYGIIPSVSYTLIF